MYTSIRKFLFQFDPEKVHYFSMNCLRWAASTGIGRSIIRNKYAPKHAEPIQLFGLNFPNKVGLAAGFDKNALYLNELQLLGFGHVEIGTVTPLAQAGNDKPRLFRLPKDKAIINRMGFNNDGMEVIASRLKQWRCNNPQASMIIGGNIGKNKHTPNEQAADDYVKCFNTLAPYVDYFVVNVSSPNTPGLRALQEKDALLKIFQALKACNNVLEKPRPLLLKIAPDLTNEQLQDVAALAMELPLQGLVISNTTIERKNLSENGAALSEKIGAGGLSGAPVFARSTEVLDFMHKQVGDRIPLIGSGGILNKNDADAKMAAGAKLVQVWTGFIYTGPSIIKSIA